MSSASPAFPDRISPAPLEMLSSADRVRMAARSSSPTEVLRDLAKDDDIIVRAALAINGACDKEVDLLLVRDADDRVRALLGGRIARLLPAVDEEGQNEAIDHVHRTLAILATDEATRVRVAIAEEIKSLENAPRNLVLLLARDHAAEVSGPVLRLSPVLTDKDLLSLVATPPSSNSPEFIAARPQLSATVADAIVAYAGAPAIRTLLTNRSACIQEATLDALVGRAPDHSDWHAPLVRRPHLSAKAIRALSEFIAIDLLHILADRVDLDPARLELVRNRLAVEAAKEDETIILAEARRLKSSKALNEALMLQTAEVGDTRRLAVFLSVASGFPVIVVDRMVELRSVKALVSLVWVSGFSMRVGRAIQTVLAQFAPAHILAPTPGGNFPLSKEEMEWQLELMRDETVPSGPTLSVRSI